MKKNFYTSIAITLLIAIFSVLPTSGLAYYKGGAPTPEDAVEQYYWGQYMLDSSMTIEVTQFSSEIERLIRKNANPDVIRSHVREYTLSEDELPIYHQDAIEWYINHSFTHGQERECLKTVLQQEKLSGTIPYSPEEIEIQFVQICIPASSDSSREFEGFPQNLGYQNVGLEIENSAVVYFNVVNKRTGEIESAFIGAFQIDGSWYVYDPCNWHYYVE